MFHRLSFQVAFGSAVKRGTLLHAVRVIIDYFELFYLLYFFFGEVSESEWDGRLM